MNKVKDKIFDIINFALGICFACCVTALADTCSTTIGSTNVIYSGNQTVKAKLDSLLSQANTINNTFDYYFRDNPSSYFDDHSLEIVGPNNGSSSWTGLEITAGSTKYSTLYYGQDTKYGGNATILAASNGTEWGAGKLDIWGDQVLANGKEVGTKLLYEYILIGNITLNGNGWYEVPAAYKHSGGYLFATIQNTGSNTAAVSLVDDGSSLYVIGSPNQTVSALGIDYYYVE